MDNNTLVKRIKKYMLDENISILRMAELCKIDRSTLTRILSDRSQYIRELTKLKILKVIGD